ncbi:hypothetical protein JXR01_03755 [Candidatus Kaiserbacteria bacterium]|nr:MAG: hypothetical protein JXR01_03755 [Candidatus Kaiserbacteria bacterium]
MKYNLISIKNTLVYVLAIIVAVLLISLGGFQTSGITIIPEQALAGGGGGGGGCFIAGTQVQLSDGTTKAIEGVVEGDVVVGRDGSLNTVIDTFTPLLGSRSLYSINGSDAFVTGGHPFLDVNGIWRAIDVAEAAKENPQLTVEPLTVGNTVVTTTGTVLITDITASIHDATTQLYNFHTNNTNTFIADSYVVHNKGGGGGGGGAGGSTGDAGGGIGGFGDGKSGGGTGGDYTLDLPVSDQPPTVPTLDIQSSTCVIGASAPSIIVTASDPQNYNIRYQIDKGADGTIDQYVPASGYVASGSSQQISVIYANAGAQTVRVRAEAEPVVVTTSNTYSVGADCNGGHCWNNDSTADKICELNGYDYADTYDTTTSLVTSRFCSWATSSGGWWSCDGSCSSCGVAIGQVSCANTDTTTTTVTTEPGLLSEWSDTLTFSCEGEAPPVIIEACAY